MATRAHMLAMYVVLENYLGMVCDYPDAYIGQPGFDFIQQVPTTWDETKVMDAKVGEWICIARRKGEQWFIGSITNSTSREINLHLDFLTSGESEATIYADATDTNENPNHLKISTIPVKQGDIIKLKLESGGGGAIVIRRK